LEKNHGCISDKGSDDDAKEHIVMSDSNTDADLVEQLLFATRQGYIDWSPCGNSSDFVATHSRWTLRLHRYAEGSDVGWELRLINPEDQESLTVNSRKNSPIAGLYELVSRHIRRVS